MEIIQNGAPSICAIWGEPEWKDTAYRLYCYVIQTECEAGMLLHNRVTGELIFLDEEEKQAIVALPSHLSQNMLVLVKKHFLVPLDYEDKKTVDKLRRVLCLLKRGKPITHYHILPTSHCNAQCFYCYENGFPRESMSEETAHKLVQFIEKHCGDKKEVTLDWFGGEPTLYIDRIDQICMELAERNIAFTSLMISNGYLFSDEILDKAKKIWNLTNIQITLDGTEDLYNKTKSYINAKGSPYATVMNNILKLADKKVHVVIRLNLDCHNGQDLDILINELSARFSGNPYINVYVAIIHENLGIAPISHKLPDYQWLEMRWDQLRNRIAQEGLRHTKGNLPKLASDFCMAGDDTTLLVTPAGMLSKCEHKVFDSMVGTLAEGITSLNEVEHWKTQKIWDRCASCSLYPNCYVLERCSIARICTDASIERGIEKTILLMKRTYEQWKTKSDYEEELQ